MKTGLWVLLAGLSLGTVAQATQQRVNFEVGRYQNAIEIVSIESAALDRQALDALRRTLETTDEPTCAGGPTSDPLRDFQEGLVEGFRSSIDGGNCTFRENEVGNGTFSSNAVCRPPNGSFEAVTEFRGSFTPSSIGGDFTIDVHVPGSQTATPALRVEARFRTRLVGPC